MNFFYVARFNILLALVYALAIPANAQTLPASASKLVCSKNDYALCSHANCDCLSAEGKTHSKCELYSKGSDAGWAKCECPVVHTANTGDNAAYNPNFATLGCKELENPSENGTAFPGYVTQKIADVYSTYSFGDSLNGNLYGTRSDAELIVCDSPKIMTLCLDMPCTVDKNGIATCYCQNVKVNTLPQTCESGQPCPPQTSWNTLGADCDQSQCDPGTNKVWSAAFINQTVAGIHDLTEYIHKHGNPSFSDSPQYCQVTPLNKNSSSP